MTVPTAHRVATPTPQRRDVGATLWLLRAVLTIQAGVAVLQPVLAGHVMHCHNLEHEDMAMMAAFETV